MCSFLGLSLKAHALKRTCGTTIEKEKNKKMKKRERGKRVERKTALREAIEIMEDLIKKSEGETRLLPCYYCKKQQQQNPF